MLLGTLHRHESHDGKYFPKAKFKIQSQKIYLGTLIATPLNSLKY